MSDALKGLRKRIGSTVLRIFAWGKQHGGLTQVYTKLPLAWRLAIRRRLHGTAGVPMPVFPFGDVKKLAASIDQAHPPASPGVNLLGYASGEFGIAENVRSYARALERSRYPFLIVDLDAGTVSRQADRSMQRHFADTLRYADNVFFLNPEQLRIARRLLGRNAFAGHYNIGFWVWELERFPRGWRDAFDWVDEVWAPSTFARDAIGAAADKPVSCMPTPVEFEPPAGMDRAHFGLPRDTFVFLFSYDFNSFAARKNPDAVIAAFRLAFADGVRDVRLLVKSTNGHVFPDRLAELARAAAGDARIEVRDGFLTRTEMFGLENSVDCYVSLHRAEGFGLGMAECMYLGKPVVATGYSGNLDFMTRDNSLLVDYSMVPLREGDYMCWRGQSWAEPDVAHAGRLMRQVFDDRDLASRIGARAATSIRRTHSYAVCADALARRLREIDGHKAAAG